VTRLRSEAPALVAVLLLLAGCGGGNDSSGSASAGGLSLAPASLSFAADGDGPLPAVGNIQVTITDPSAAYVVVGFPAGSTPPAWINLSLDGGGASWTCHVAVNTTLLPAGRWTATVRILIARADQTVIAYRDAPVVFTVAPNLTADPATLALAGLQGGPLASAQQVTVGGSYGVDWTATPSDAWIVLDRTSGIVPADVLQVSADPTGLSTGTHSGSVRLSGAGKTVDVAVSFAVGAALLQTDQASLAFSGVNGAPIAGRSLGLSMNNGAALPWTATTADPWLVLDRTSGTLPDTVSVSVNPAVGPLASGSRSSTINLTASSGGTTWHATVRVDLSLSPAQLSLSPAALVIGGADGRDPTAKAIQLGLDTGSNVFGWTATPSAAWMEVASAATTTAGTPVSVQVTPNPAGLAGGTRLGSILFSATVNGDIVTASLPVTFNWDAHRLLVSEDGVALSVVPGFSRLTRTVRVTDTLGAGAPWSATSSQTWLAVTPGGTADGDLVLTADPTGLATDALYEADVTVASADASVENVETVRVGLWVGGTAPTTQTVSVALTEVIADPVRPRVYAHGSGGGISVYNAYTGASEGTITGLPATIGAMAIASDGRTLWVVDEATFRVYPVRLSDWSVGAGWLLASGANPKPRLAYARTDGFPLLIGTDGAIHAAGSGSVLTMFAAVGVYSSDLLVTASRDGHTFCFPSCESVRYSVLGGGSVTTASLAAGGGSRDVALVADGSVVLGASGSPYTCQGWNTASGAQLLDLAADAYPNNVEVGSDGRLYCAAFSWYGSKDVWVYDPSSAPIGSLRVAGYAKAILDHELVVSGDGRRLAVLTDDPALVLVSTP
jgi:hypothetical protein